ncbi:biflaviolin synthase [Actinophytocola oryzae]|uniref:Biflaviolin synthase n=2 Tax=Actinophytocola oryzae TaxID=502181 RepID=A0A4R7W5L9_9PSEU|nr:biflaviolin synthase [Actinophytocola oryzae]
MHALDFDPVLRRLVDAPRAERLTLTHGSAPVWVFTHHDDVRVVTSDARFSRRAVLTADAGRNVVVRPLLDDDATYQDGATHARIRHAMARVFTRARIDRSRARVESVATSLVERMRDRGTRADLVESLTSPFALEIACDTVGVPREMWPAVCDGLEKVFETTTAARDALRAREDLAERFASLVAAARRDPGDDLIGVLATDGVDRLTDEQITAAAFHTTHAGWQAIRNHSANMLYLLLTRPREMERLRAEPAGLDAAVEEMLRFIPRMGGVGVERIATEDVRVGGVTVARGEAVYVSYAAANRDPRVFPEPDQLDLGRSDNSHVAYGYGPHYCPAAALATVELHTVITAVLRGLPGVRLAVAEQDVPWRTGSLLRGPRSLPVVW